jgi:ribonuclease P protein component
VLPAANRLRTSKEFELVTKTGQRATSLSLVLYFKAFEKSDAPRVGLIVNSSVGGSVVRHRVSRQLRHAIAPYLSKFPSGSELVIRVLRKKDSYSTDLNHLVNKIVEKSLAQA